MAAKKIPSLVRASDYDPSQGPATFYNPAERYLSLEQGMEINPGRRPNGTGTTGLMSGDSRGYTNMLQQQQEYLRLQALINGSKAPEVERGGVSSTAMPYAPTFDPSFQGSALQGLQRAGTRKR